MQKSDPLNPPSDNEPGDQAAEDRPQVSLTAAGEEKFVNTVVMRTGEPAHVPLTTNLGLKYERRTLYFPMDFGELT